MVLEHATYPRRREETLPEPRVLYLRRQLKAAGDYAALQRLPRDASPTRLRHMCALTGRTRGCYRKLKISRIKLRELALEGKIPGMRKASW